jgi:hypothetical protein
METQGDHFNLMIYDSLNNSFIFGKYIYNIIKNKNYILHKNRQSFSGKISSLIGDYVLKQYI